MLHINGITINPVERTIAHKGVTVQFKASNNSPYAKKYRSVQFDIACRLICAPATADELWEMLYAYDPNGGPGVGNDVIKVHVAHLKPKLAKLHLQIYAGKSGRDRCYREHWIAP